ncbi:DCC1-like thiol-disulfide oxidoreductase family protein [uncultured Aquimarina sp.]|uniref:DCC1-like thiol-disulfide oxidoreductase family protein n=1 Tax=uncultured Aquimarina sp. TaxID=575652 RepID=UPI00263757A6|nr:DCC1-like thiol-disulfide oxidoreductase family protein [uncultured Aquimarina sp.]
MNTYLKMIRDHWFMKVTPQRLALLRIATGLFSLWYLLSRFNMLQKMIKNVDAYDPIGLLSWMDQPVPSTVFWWITIGVIFLNIAYIIGWKFKFTGPAFAIIILLYFTYRNSWSMVYHNRNALILHMVILGLVASADAWSWDAFKKAKKGYKPPKVHWQYGWPIQLICVVTAGSYFLSGIAKLAGDLALEWANGSAMRSQVAVDAIRKEVLGSEAAPLFDFLFEHTWLFLGMGILTFILELGAPLALVKRRWGMAWALMTWMMHWGIFFIMGISFRYQMTGLIFLSFFDVEKLWNPSKKKLAVAFSKKDHLKTTSGSIILFDGVCNLCNGWIQFILKREKNQHYHFASLQSETAESLLADSHISQDLSSIVLIEDGIIYQKSDAVLRICRNLKYPWYLGHWWLITPKVFRDRIYDFIAANRYNWFGKQQQCGLLNADQRVRFLDDPYF